MSVWVQLIPSWNIPLPGFQDPKQIILCPETSYFQEGGIGTILVPVIWRIGKYFADTLYQIICNFILHFNNNYSNFCIHINYFVRIQNLLYMYKTVCTHTKPFVCITKLFYTCTKSSNNRLHIHTTFYSWLWRPGRGYEIKQHNHIFNLFTCLYHGQHLRKHFVHQSLVWYSHTSAYHCNSQKLSYTSNISQVSFTENLVTLINCLWQSRQNYKLFNIRYYRNSSINPNS